MDTTRTRSWVLAVLAGGVLAGGMAACGDDGESAGAQGDAAASQPEGPAESTEASTNITGGSTLLRLSPGVERIFDLAGVKLEPAGSAEAAGGGIRIPIAAGDVDIDTPSGRIQHMGGLRFSAAGRSVEATNLVIKLDDGTVTGDVGGETIPLMDADFGRPRVPPTGDVIVLPATAATLTGSAGDALGERLGIDAFKDGLRLGRLTVNAKRP